MKLTSELLTISLLEKYKQVHQDLVVQFFVLRNQGQLLGQGLKARFACGGGNALEKALENGEINDYEYQVIWAMIDCYQAIFNLIQMNWKVIKKYLFKYMGDYFKEQSLTSEVDLFLELLREHYDNHFEQCIEECYTFTPSNAAYRVESMQYMAGAIDKGKNLAVISSKERQKVGLPSYHKRFFLFQAVLGICSGEKRTSFYYNEVWRSLARLTEIYKNNCEKEIEWRSPSEEPQINENFISGTLILWVNTSEEFVESKVLPYLDSSDSVKGFYYRHYPVSNSEIYDEAFQIETCDEKEIILISLNLKGWRQFDG